MMIQQGTSCPAPPDQPHLLSMDVARLRAHPPSKSMPLSDSRRSGAGKSSRQDAELTEIFGGRFRDEIQRFSQPTPTHQERPSSSRAWRGMPGMLPLGMTRRHVACTRV
jgi:hypothetical protein